MVASAVSVTVRDPAKVSHEAMLDPEFVGDVDGLGPDLALVELTDVPGHVVDVPGMGLAAVDRDSVSADPVEGCHAVGYPAFMEREAPGGGLFRETADVVGQVPVLSGLARGLLSVQVSSAHHPLPPRQTPLRESPWSGMSGGPLVAGGLLLGVVTEHAPRQGDSAITATPLTALEKDPKHLGWGRGVTNPGEWWARLGVSGMQDLCKLPTRRHRAEPAHWETVKVIRQRTGMLIGRQGELAEIGSFAAGAEAYRRPTGGPWAGKTALLAEAVAALQGGCDVVCYFMSRREGDADSSRFVTTVVPQLAYLLDEDPPVADLDQLRALWQRATQRADAEGRHLLLVVDGLDEDLRPPGLPSVAALLPPAAGGRIHVLVSSRPSPELPKDLPVGHPLAHTHSAPLAPFEGGRELAALASQEIDGLLRRDDDGLVADVLGLLTAAAGPLAVDDLAAMTVVGPPSAALTRRIRRLCKAEAARSLQPAGPARGDRYQFAHASLLEQAQGNEDLNDPEFLHRLHWWADSWRAAGWPPADGAGKGTPQYLLDTYPSTLTRHPQRLAALVSDAGWIEQAVQSVGVDQVLADLRRAAAADPASTAVAAVLAAVTGQAYDLRSPQPVWQPGYILRQLWMQAAELGEDDLAEDIRSRLQSRPGPGLVPRWTTRRASRALSGELGRHDGPVGGVAVLSDGRVVTGGGLAGRVLVWDPASPEAAAAELGRDDGGVEAVAVLPDGRVVTGGGRGRVMLWDPARPRAQPTKLGRHGNWVTAVAVLPDGRVVTGGHNGRVLVWDPASPGALPTELGRHGSWVHAVAVLPDGRVVTAGHDGRVLLWDQAHPRAKPTKLGRHGDWVIAVAVLADGRVVTGGHDGLVLVWEPASPGGPPAELGRHHCLLGGVDAIAVLPDGRVVTGGSDGTVLVWDLGGPGAPTELGRDDDTVTAMAVLHDGRVITGGFDGRVLLWDPASPETGAELGRDDDTVAHLAVLADGRVVTAGIIRLLLWDPAAPGAAPAELGRLGSWGHAMAGLADGRMVTAGYDGRVLLWDPAAPGAAPAELGHYGSQVVAVAVLPDGRVVSGGDGGRLLLWDPARPGTAPVELGRHWYWVNAVAVLADGRVVSGGDGGRLLLWDPARPGAAPVELGSHDRGVNAAAVLPDGRVVTGGDSGRLLLWDPARPKAGPAELGCHDGPVHEIAVLPAGRVVTGGIDRWVLIWDPAEASALVIRLNCSLNTLATGPPGPAGSTLAIAHHGGGLSLWSATG